MCVPVGYNLTMSTGEKKKRKISLSAQILWGLVLGIFTGLFFGELVAFFDVPAKAYILLLQMTVLPYIMVSLVTGLGGISLAEMKLLAKKGGFFLLLFYGLTFAVVLVLPLAFPPWETASFFTTSLVEQPEPFDFLGLYIPANPFFSLANNVVPAVVLFSIVLGVALIGIERKQGLIDVLSTVQDALARVTKLVIKLTPYGIFAIGASAAGTMEAEEFGRLQVYLITFMAASLLLSLWIIPGLVTCLTPISWRELVGDTRDALITAFMTGNLFIILPFLIERAKELLAQHRMEDEQSSSLVDVVVATSFNFPHVGKILMLLFVLFAGWFSGYDVSVTEYPTFAFVGLLTMFGSSSLSVPYLLDMLRIPADLFELFVAVGFVNFRFATLAAAMFTLALGLLSTCAITGHLKVNGAKLIRYTVISLVLTALTVAGCGLLLRATVENEYTKDKVLAGMQTLVPPAPAVIHDEPPPPPEGIDPEAPRLAAIIERGSIRVGFFDRNIPYTYFNADGDLVGLDAEMAYLLADELGVGLEFVPLVREDVNRMLSEGYCDVLMSGWVVTTDRAREVQFTDPYLSETLAFLVKDHLREAFSSRDSLSELEVRLGMFNVPYFRKKVERLLPHWDLVPVTALDVDRILRGEIDVDAILVTAERGSAWSLLYPQYSVVVPRPKITSVPLAYAVPLGQTGLAGFLDTWIELKKQGGTYDQLYRYWILGETVALKTEPRWSIIRDVLHWVE